MPGVASHAEQAAAKFDGTRHAIVGAPLKVTVPLSDATQFSSDGLMQGQPAVPLQPKLRSLSAAVAGEQLLLTYLHAASSMHSFELCGEQRFFKYSSDESVNVISEQVLTENPSLR